jgi:hypothetical protein
VVDPRDIKEVERASDRALARALDDLDEQAKFDERVLTQIRNLAREYRMPGNSCDSGTLEAFEEAVAHSQEGMRRFCFATLQEAMSSDAENEYANAVCVLAFRAMLDGYWEEMSMHLASRHILKNLDHI